jgi:hypothetical protein
VVNARLNVAAEAATHKSKTFFSSLLERSPRSRRELEGKTDRSVFPWGKLCPEAGKFGNALKRKQLR